MNRYGNAIHDAAEGGANPLLIACDAKRLALEYLEARPGDPLATATLRLINDVYGPSLPLPAKPPEIHIHVFNPSGQPYVGNVAEAVKRHMERESARG